MLIAQAISETLTLLTADAQLGKYSKLVEVIRLNSSRTIHR